MKNLFKKLHSMPNQSKHREGSTSSKGTKSSEVSLLSTDKFIRSRSHDHKPFSGLSNWLNTVTNRKSPSPPSSSNVNRAERSEPSDSISSAGGGFDMVSDAVRPDSGSSTSKDPDVEEEYQIQLALELSAREDPEAVQIEAVKQISLGSCDPENTPAEVVAYRYWNYNSLSYDDKISDGFYDLYGVLNDTISERMPSLIDLQGQPFSNNVAWEAVLVNRAADANLLKLEQRAREISVRSRLGSLDLEGDLVRKLAHLVSEYMGGSVGDSVSMSRAWRSLSYSLKATLGSMVLPLGSLTIGLPRHRALMFKVLADSVGIRCRLVKGRQHTGSDFVAMNFVKLDGEREFIVDLMAAPGTLIPSDAAGSHIVLDDTFFPASPFDSRNLASSSSGVANPVEKHSEQETLNRGSKFSTSSAVGNQGETRGEFLDFANFCASMKDEEESKKSPGSRIEKGLVKEFPGRTTYPHSHARSPSWTEGVSSPAVQKKKVKDFSKRMIQAAKENPDLAQKLHDVLVESGVVAPSNIFTEICPKQSECPTPEVISPTEEKDDHKQMNEFGLSKSDDAPGPATFLPPLPHHRLRSKASPSNQTDQIKQVEELGVSHPLDIKQITGLPELPHTEAAAKYVKNVPVAAAAAAAAAAVVASSMVAAAAAKSSTETILELPMAAAAAVMATTAVTKQYDQGARSDGDTDSAGGYEPRGSGDRGSGGRDSRDVDAMGTNSEGERTSDRSAGNDSSKSDVVLDDVAEYEILWEEIKVGERIGLGSYGEVYHGEWHGTEVAVKRFLDQDISGETLEEFKQEVRIMKRLRHPNVVLFMGAVTRAPNLSIVTEFLPRGSLYRLLHRPNNQLDERRRLRMALDTARGMNYLHSSTPVIVHRDLKSPNLLVDKNWVVKVCDFGLSRMKHSTFLSSKSTAGTAEWMAPEVLRNEPSDEKSDVYSYGVILWELSTMQQPWGGMNPMQVVGAVGFQHRRLDIPDGLDPAIADIIRKCWQTDPKLRPTFTEIMAALKPLQKPITSSQVPRPLRNHHEKGQPSHEHEED